MGFKLKEPVETETKEENANDVMEDYAAMAEYNAAMRELDMKMMESVKRKHAIEDIKNSTPTERFSRLERSYLNGARSAFDSSENNIILYIICGIMVIAAMVFFGKALDKNKESKLDSVEVIGVITDMDTKEKRVKRGKRHRKVTEYVYTYEWEDEYGVIVDGSRTYSAPTFYIGENVRITVMADDYSVEIDPPETAKRKMTAYIFCGVIFLGIAVFMFIRQKKRE